MGAEVMDRSTAYRVTAPDGKVHLVVMNAGESLPAAFALMGSRAENKVAIRISGGCKGMDEADKKQMIDFFAIAFKGYRGLVWSGGTRQVTEDGKIDPMVTDVPGVIASLNPGSVALGTVPRTELMSLQGDSRLVFDQWGTVPNPAMTGILIVQNGATGSLEWDGDLDVYFQMMQDWQTYAGFNALGMVGWNGGAITKTELMRAVGLKWPTYLIKGSGRATDELIEEMLGKKWGEASELPHVLIGDKKDPEAFREMLQASKFIDV